MVQHSKLDPHKQKVKVETIEMVRNTNGQSTWQQRMCAVCLAWLRARYDLNGYMICVWETKGVNPKESLSVSCNK